jgi:hypothetical protein
MHWDGKSILFITENESTYKKAETEPPVLEPDPRLLFFFPSTALH